MYRTNSDIASLKSPKKLMILLLALCLMGSMARALAAHPPKSVNLAWQGGTLSVNVSHSVNDPQKHYVYRVVVYVNDNVASQKEYALQKTPEGFADTFNLGNLSAGTVVKAEAFCVIMGSTTGSLTVR